MKYRNILVNDSTYLYLKNNHLCFKNKEVEDKIFIPEINSVILNNPFTSITAQLISKLIENDVTIIHCNLKRLPIGITTNYYTQNTNYENLNKQMNWSPVFKKNLWKKIIENKITNQYRVLEYVTKDELILEKMLNYSKTVLSGDNSNREAAAAKLFFNTMYGDLYRRFDDDIINAVQNYGYKIVMSKITTELCRHGIIPFLGIHHKGKSNQYNLSYDLIEPFRPIIDYYIWVNIDSFSNILNYEMKKDIVSLTFENVLYKDKIYSIQSAIKSYINDFVKILNNENFNEYYFINFIDIYEK